MGKIRNVVGKTATTISTDQYGAVCCTYHRTIVAKALTLATGTTVTLDSGGYRTATTKVRMNEFARQFCGGQYSVYQTKGKWFVNIDSVYLTKGKWFANIDRWYESDVRTLAFEDGMTFVVPFAPARVEGVNKV